MTSFACVIYRPDTVPEAALSRGFAVALAGFDVPAPVVLTAELRGLPGWSAAFYASGRPLSPFEEFDHACDLFEEELPPGLAVRDAAERPDAVVYGVVYTDDLVHDDAWRFSERALLRRFVREGEEGLEAGEETLDGAEVSSIDVGPDATDREIDDAVRPRRGTALLAAELGAPVLPALVGALFEADRRVPVCLVDPSPESVARETRRLNAVLRRVDGRGGGPWPSTCAAVACPAPIAAFASVYDFDDPSDRADLYRELSIGRVEGTLHFLRPADVDALSTDRAWAPAARAGAFPLATLAPSALGASRADKRHLGVLADGSALVLLERDGRVSEAGPTLGELLLYLALGFKRRDDVEEDLIGALMLRARIRAQ